MRKTLLSVLVSSTLTLALGAQVDPVGTWIVRPYGSELIAGSARLQVRLCVSGEQLDMEVSGGEANGQVAVLLGSSAAQTPLAPIFPGATLLVPTNSPSIALQLDGGGAAFFSLDLKSLGVQVFYLQVVEAQEGSLRMSEGYEVKLYQSGLFGYSGPQLDAQVAMLEGEASVYQLSVQVNVPSAGWNLRFDSMSKSGGMIEVRFTLEDPGASSMLPFLPLNAAVNLGQRAGYAVVVMVDQVPLGTDPPANYQMAAILSTLCVPGAESSGGANGSSSTVTHGPQALLPVQ